MSRQNGHQHTIDLREPGHFSGQAECNSHDRKYVKEQLRKTALLCMFSQVKGS